MRVILFFLLAILSVTARAQIPGTDYAKLVERLVGNVQTLEQYKEYINMYKKINENLGKISAIKTDGNNNAMANWSLRSNKGKADIQNLELKEKLTPAIDACSSLAASVAESPCPRRAFVEGLYPTNWERASEIAGGLGKNTKVSYRMGGILSRAQQSYPVGFASPLEVGGADGVTSGGASISSVGEESFTDGDDVIPFEPVAMLSGDFQYLTLLDEDMQSTIDFIDLIAPPFVYTERMELEMDIDPKYKVSYMRQHAVKDVARVSLQDIAALRSPSEAGISALSAMQDFDDTQTSLAEKIGYSNIAVPSVVWRNIAIMKTFQVHMALERYKLSLKREGVIATDFGNRMNSN